MITEPSPGHPLNGSMAIIVIVKIIRFAFIIFFFDLIKLSSLRSYERNNMLAKNFSEQLKHTITKAYIRNILSSFITNT